MFEAGPATEIAENLRTTLELTQSTTQVLLITTREGDLPYQTLLTHRIDVLNLATRADDSLLIFDEPRQPRNALHEPVLAKAD